MKTPSTSRRRFDLALPTLVRGCTAVLASLSLSHCVAGTSTTMQHITQSSLVPVAMDPRAVGPLVPEGRVAVEASLATAATADATGTRETGRPGQFNGTTVGALRASTSPHRRLEIGLSAEYTSGYWARPAATDLGADDLNREDAWRGGVDLRWLFVGDRTLGAGLLGGFSVASLPFRRDVTSATTFTARDPSAGSVSWGSPATRDDHPITVPTWQVGLFTTARVTRHLDLGGGFLAQSQPYVVGAQVATTRCEYERGQLFATSCSGTDADHTPRFLTDVLGTFFVSAGVTLGRVTLLGQLHAHALGVPETTALSRFGGTLGARVVLW